MLRVKNSYEEEKYHSFVVVCQDSVYMVCRSWYDWSIFPDDSKGRSARQLKFSCSRLRTVWGSKFLTKFFVANYEVNS
jgi:hypothetical protein